jgi:hypothetical protein
MPAPAPTPAPSVLSDLSAPTCVDVALHCTRCCGRWWIRAPSDWAMVCERRSHQRGCGWMGGYTSAPSSRTPKFQGTRLQINANAGGAGQIRVQLIDPTSTKALATSSPFFGNAVDATLSFSGQQHCVQSLAGRAVQVRFDFVGEGVELFAFQFV